MNESARAALIHKGGLCYAIVAYHFPPATTAGAVRAYGLARALGESGNDVHVFTPCANSGGGEPFEVHNVPGGESGDTLKAALGVQAGSSLRSRLPAFLAPAVGRVLSLAKEWVFYPDTARTWGVRCSGVLAEWLRCHDCDVVISSSPPVSAHIAAFRALEGASRPVWIADWRDLWTRNPHYDYGSWREARDRRLEQRLVRTATALTVTTGEMAVMLGDAYPEARVVSVYNGYDERIVSARPRATREGPLTITHAGSLYQGKRSVTSLLEAIADLVADGRIDRDRIRLRFAGPSDTALAATVNRLGLSDIVEILGVVPRAMVPELLERSDVLLIVAWDARRERSLIPAKTFEYMAAGRPILAMNCLAKGELGVIMSETEAGWCVDGGDEIREVLLHLWLRHEAGLPLLGTGHGVDRYTHQRMASEFDDLARSLLGFDGDGMHLQVSDSEARAGEGTG